jgi:tetratricopeptide (TPR) repeat protein
LIPTFDFVYSRHPETGAFVSDRSHRVSAFVRSVPMKAILVLTLLVACGCAEVRARKVARDGNALYRDGEYAAAVEKYQQSEELYPDLAVVALNKGLACRQMMLPGVKSSENEKAADCALRAFERLGKLNPEDARADQLYVQTLFDADRYQELEARYKKQLAGKPNEIGALNGLIQVYTRWDKWNDALETIVRRADIESKDAEAQYAVGAFIWTRLFTMGGGADKSAYDPRVEAPAPEPKRSKGRKGKKQAEPEPPKPEKQAPAFNVGDVYGAQRIALADRGISFLERALAIRPTYREAMTYMNLLYRQKSFAYFDKPEEWQKAIDSAEMWRKKAMEGHTPPAAPAPAPPASAAP